MKLDDYEFRNVPQEIVDFKDDITFIMNFGKYSAQVTSTVPDWSARNGEFLFYRDANTRRIYFYINDAWDFIDTESSKSWVNFSGTAAPDVTINQSYNIKDVTRVSVGYYMITFTNNLANANMVPSGMARTLTNDALVIIPFVGTVSSLEVKFVDVANNLKDPNPGMINVFGD